MRSSIFATLALAALVAGASIARADDFGNQQNGATEYNAGLEQQATDAQLSDPTAPHSIRSHGNH